MPGPGRRSVDLRLDGRGDTILIEVETRVGSLEEIVRELHSKRRAFVEAACADRHRRVDVVLVLPLTRRHSTMVKAHPEIVRAAFPVSSPAIRRALTSASHPWPGDGILWVRRPVVAPGAAIVTPGRTKPPS